MYRTTGINYGWRYSPDFRDEYLLPEFDDGSFKEINIPHTNILLPLNNFRQTEYQFESCYRKELSIDKPGKDVHVFVRFEGVMARCRVFCNGIECGEHSGGYTPFRADITGALDADERNILAVYVDSREDPGIPPFGNVVDYLSFGGIYREVRLEYCDSLHVEAAVIKPLNVTGGSPELEADLYIKNLTGTAGRVSLAARLIFEGVETAGFESEADYGSEEDQLIRIREAAGSVRLWSPDEPNLYELQIEMNRGGRSTGRYSYRFGFRETEFRPDGFYLNGKKIKLLGLNRHQSYPYAGYAMPAGAQKRDAEILRYELGVNTVRCSHYPQSRHFLDRCDEIGLLVFDEIPGWQHIGDEDWKMRSLENVESMIKTNANHPSIFIWGVRINESADDDEFYRMTNAAARRMDPTRPTGGVRRSTGSSLLEDVYTYNDFSHSGSNSGLLPRRKVIRKKVPYLVTEHNGHMFPTKKYDDEAHRLSQAKRHLAVIDRMFGDDEVAGAIGWCMFDYNTHKDFGSGDKICYHGVTDAFRILKYAAWAYSSQQDDFPVMEIAGSMNIGEHEGSMLAEVWVFTNCDRVDFFKNGRMIKSFSPRRDLYPNLPHPPVVIDDFVGSLIRENEDFSDHDSALIKKLLSRAGKTGGRLGPVDSLRAGLFMLRTGLNHQDAEDLYTKYFGGWGGEAVSYRFEGYRNGECVVKRTVEQDSEAKLILQADRSVLTEEGSWDAVRCTVRLTDDHGNSLSYANDAFSLRCEGPLDIIGPSTLALSGGSTGFWVRSLGRSGNASVILDSERFGRKTLDFQINRSTA